MLFKIHESIITQLKNTNNSDTINIGLALENLATALREGRHLLYCDIRILDYLSEYRSISNNSRAVYTKLYHDYATNSFEDLITKSTMLYYGNNIQHDCSLNILELSSSNYLNKTILLTENLIDTSLFENIANKYLEHIGVNYITINLRRDAGGGSQTYVKFQEIIDTKEDMCLCICDSDKKYPNSSFGETYKQLARVKMTSICELYCLNVRETENIIPEIIYTQHQNYRNDDFKIIPPDCCLYLDYKKGLTLEKLNKSSSKKKYWNNILNIHGIVVAEEVSKNGVIIEDGTIIKGMGDKFLGKMNKFISKDFPNTLESKIKRKKELREKISSIPESAITYLEEELKICKTPFKYLPLIYYNIWEEIALKVINWCCGSLGLNIGIY